jgi:hypothetical protein
MHFLRRLRYPLRVTALIASTVLSMSAVTSAWAADAGTPLQPGWDVQSATVVCPGQPQRSLTSMQAATFLQSWLPDALFAKLTAQDPPSGIPRCTVTVLWTFAGQPPQAPAQIGFATNGKRVWIRLPPGKWSIAAQTQRVIDSFHGRGTYIPIASTTIPSTTLAPTTIPPTTPRGAQGPHNSSKTWAWLAVLGAGGALVILAGLRWRRGRGKAPAARNAG